MKNIIKLILIIAVYNPPSFTQVNWDPDYNSANFAFLAVDFNTYNFEGGYFTKFDYYPGYDVTGIPFTIVYNPPIDYGNIMFAYSATGDTIFAADIWWAGQGEITFPDSLEDASQFTYDSSLSILPYSVSYLDYVFELEDSVFHQKADSAWLAIRKLSVLEKFDSVGNVFRVGLYLYAPSVGSFEPTVAKWIIFLYRGQLIVGVNDEIKTPNTFKLYQNYPNPFNPSTIIKYTVPDIVTRDMTSMKLKVYDVLGKEVATLIDGYKSSGEHQVEFSAEGLPSGIYLYSLTTGNFTQTKKMLLLK